MACRSAAGARALLRTLGAWLLYCCALWDARLAHSQANRLYPDMFPYVEENAPDDLRTLQAWERDGSRIVFSTMFANQGDGLFEIRKGPALDASRYQLLQRVYVNNDFGSQFVDLPIGTAPIPGTPGTPDPEDLNVIWFEDFAHFSLLEAPIVDGLLTVGEEVAGKRKTSWRLTSNRGPLPGYNRPVQSSPDMTLQQRVSVGWADMYEAGARSQFIDISGVPLGPRYWLRQTVDPQNRIFETDETNNSFAVLIDLARPGEAVTFVGKFVQPGDEPPPTPGDLTNDGIVDVDDWVAFKAGAQTNLAGLTPEDAYFLGDLNSDGAHSLHDVLLFRQYFDGANGAGALDALQSVPEPTTMALGLALASAVLVGARRLGKAGRRALAIMLSAALAGASSFEIATARVSLFREDFEGVVLRPNLHETLANPAAWTDAPPPGWTVNDAGVPTFGIATRGVKEWEGWSFSDKSWWAAAAGDQERSRFQLGAGIVAVADPDEWEDRGSPVNGSSGLPPLGYYNALMRTPAISLAAAPGGFAKLSFASSWRDECCDDGPNDSNNQTAVIRASYNGGATFSEALRWESNPSSSFFKNDAPNELVTLNLNNPSGASSVILEFGLLNAGNDWWWAVDNVEVFVPSTLTVDVASGQMAIENAAGLAGYEITSSSGGLLPLAWKSGNLDAQNYGSPTPASSDFNNDARVDGSDFLVWQRGFDAASGATPAHGDANGDGAVSAADFDLWQSQLAGIVPAGASWETLIATDKQFLEYFLAGQSTFGQRSIGQGFDVEKNARDLRFFYTDSEGALLEGAVVYATRSVALQTHAGRSVPEPMGCLLGGAVVSWFFWDRRRPLIQGGRVL